MAAQAGPSNPLKIKRTKPKGKNALKSGKAKKLSEKQQIAELEKAATEFVSCGGAFSSALTDRR